ncbi:MAG: hypothetical protein KDM81_05575, partial [Verrucomicrobiae bacterium]|nr:hypothetical protein [Verrucomicrobiae bacterium]
ETEGMRFAPCLPEGITHLELANLQYREAIMDIRVYGQGQRVEEMLVNGKPETLIAATTRGKVEVVIRVGK